MNKITTSLLAGVALAAIAAAPASAANGIFNNTNQTLSGFSFGAGFPAPGSTYTLTAAPVVYYTTAGANFGTLTLSGGSLVAGTFYNYANTQATFTSTSGGASFTDFGTTAINMATGVPSFSAVGGLSGGGSTSDDLNLNYAAVPEASTVISFGALLALGGLAVLRRKSVARAS